MPPQPQANPEEKGSRISNTEWGLVIGFCLMVDLCEYGLDAIIVGPFVNPLIDLVMWASIQLYFWLRGVKKSNLKLVAWIGAPALAAISLGTLSFWSVDVAVTMVLDKAEAKLKKIVPLVAKVDKIATRVKNKFKKAA